MKHTYSQVWVHLVWTTKAREPILFETYRKDVFMHIREISANNSIHIDMINGTADHVHCLISLEPKFSISDIVNKLKGESSHWINEDNLIKLKFSWQRGFGAFSVSNSEVRKIRKYIINQEEHHKHQTFLEEWDELLKAHSLG